MEVRLDQIQFKPSDFKVCKSCNKINWYENEICFFCGKRAFNNSKKMVEKAYQNELDFWISEGYSEAEADAIFYEV